MIPENVRLHTHWDSLAADALEIIALKVKPRFIPVFVANFMWIIGMKKCIRSWFSDNMIVSISEKNDQLHYQRESYQYQPDTIKEEMKKFIAKCFKTCSVCGTELDPIQYGMISKCNKCQTEK